MRAKLTIGILLFLVALFFFSYYVIQSGQRDAYTVLYFSNPTQPLLYDVDSKIIAFNFTVANHEYSPKKYTYKIKVLSSENIGLAYKEGNIELGHEKNVTVSEVLSVAKNPVGGKLYVELYINNSTEPYRAIWQWIR